MDNIDQADTAPVITDTAPEVIETPSQTEPAPEQSNFSLPDAYKDKPWAAKIKTQEDVYKQIDNLNSLVGKKVLQPIDYSSATPEEIKAYHESLAPKDVSEYKFSEGADPEFSKILGETFKEAGLNAYQAKLLSDKVSQYSQSRMEADRSADGYIEIMKNSFGDEYEKAIGVVENNLKSHLSDEDKGFMDNMDNQTKGVVDRAVYNVSKAYEERIAKILKEHGASETSAHIGAESGDSTVDVAEVRKNLRAELITLDKRPHTYEERKAIIDKLDKTYR